MRSNHLTADVADDKTEILQRREVTAVEHVWKKTTRRLESTRLREASGAETLAVHDWPSHPKCEVGSTIDPPTVSTGCVCTLKPIKYSNNL